MYVTAHPVLEEIVNLPKAKVISASLGLSMVSTLMPIALPSSRFLGFMRSAKEAALCHPSALVDGALLEPAKVRWDVFNSAAICLGYFKGRMLVSARDKQSTNSFGLFEYDCQGNFNQTILLPAGTGAGVTAGTGTISTIISGHKHVACCTNKGGVLFIRPKAPQIDRDGAGGWDNSHGVRDGADQDGFVDDFGAPRGSMTHGLAELSAGISSSTSRSSSAEWDTPISISSSTAGKILCGAAVTHGGVDIFFTVDNLGQISVTFLDDLAIVGSFVNTPISTQTVVALIIGKPYLYVALNDGNLMTIDISRVLEGAVGTAGELKRYILFEEEVFHWRSGIHSAAILSSNGHLKLSNEDDPQPKKQQPIPGAVKHAKKDALEGYLVLLGGGDVDPRVVVLRPGKGVEGSRQVACLVGHSTAVTQIVTDAAGRSIFSGSLSSRQIIVWDGLSFESLARLEDVPFSRMALGYNCLFTSSYKTPFLKFWKVQEEDDRQTQSNDTHNWIPQNLIPATPKFSIPGMTPTGMSNRLSTPKRAGTDVGFSTPRGEFGGSQNEAPNPNPSSGRFDEKELELLYASRYTPNPLPPIHYPPLRIPPLSTNSSLSSFY